VASFVTFVHVVRPTILRCRRAATKLVPMPVRAGFAYTKKIARRESYASPCLQSRRRECEAVKFPREGDGLLSALVTPTGAVVVKIAEERSRASSPARGSVPVL